MEQRYKERENKNTRVKYMYIKTIPKYTTGTLVLIKYDYIYIFAFFTN